MKVPVSWLREFVDAPGTPQEIAATMSVRGFAVEGIEPLADGDAVIDFEVTANRPDCLSVLGLAREVATAYGLPLVARGHAGRFAALAGTGDAGVDVVLEAPALGPRYAGAVADVAVAPAPDWMQARLRACGVRPISNVVDITNYVLLELGQPMHAFDLERLSGPAIRVRQARAGERLTTLDGQTRELTPDMLVIADAERAAAVAGVMGGADSEVTGGTRAIVFESAYFDPRSVRRTAKALGLKTEASQRFERGADPEAQAVAMARACALLEQTGAGRARGTIVDRREGAAPLCRLPLDREALAAFLGVAVPDGDVVRILESLGFRLDATPSGWDVEVPPRRVDVARTVDLFEDVARHYGFDRIPATFPVLASAPPPSDPRVARARRLRSVMTGEGFFEAVTFGFIAEPLALSSADAADLVPIANPLSETFAVLRPSIVPGLLAAAAHNLRRQQRDVRLFEIGAVFSRARGERRALTAVWTGTTAGDHWSGTGGPVDVFDVKDVAERVCRALRADVHVRPSQDARLVAGRRGDLVSGDAVIGVLGLASPALTAPHDLGTTEVYVLDLDLDAAEACAAHGEPRVRALPRYPSVTRDLSIVVADTLPAATLRATAVAAAPSILAGVREFDRYQGTGIPEGSVSLSIRLTFQSPDRTLTDADVQAATAAVLRALQTAHGAVQR